MTDKRPRRRSVTDCRLPPGAKTNILSLSFHCGIQGRKQLRGFRPMPLLERFLIESYIVHNIREPTGVERPRFEVANNLDFGESDYNCIQGNSDVAGANLPGSPHG